MSGATLDEQAALAATLDPEKWGDLEWRLTNLYWIVDEHGKAVRFDPNEEQLDFVRNLHTRNLILKARQLGFSTLLQLLELDQAIFNANHNGVVIADTLPNAGKLFAKVEFAYGKLPEALRQALPIKSQASKTGLEFEHGSTYYVSTSSRGGTVQFLHVSELGKIARKYPERAAEIVSGAFESVPQDGVIVVESTAEGAAGEFFDLCDVAMKRQAENAPETPLDWRLHFYPWFKKAAYRLNPGDVIVGEKDHKYFDKLQAELGVTIDPAQRAWYVKKRETLGRLMKREYPSCIAGTEPAFSPAGITRMDDVQVDGSVVLGFFPKGERDVFRLTTDLGYEVLCTGDHPIKTPTGFVELQNLRVGSQVMIGAAVASVGSHQTHRHSPLPCVQCVVDVTTDFAELLGFFMGDGSYHDGTLSIVCDAGDTDVVDRVTNLMTQFVAVPTTRVVGSKLGGAEVRVGSVKFGEVLDSMGMLRRNSSGGLKRRVHVPRVVNESLLPQAAAFLRGLFEADGFAQRNGTGVKLFTKYEQFGRDVQLLLLRFGITCRRTRRDKVAGNGSTYEGWELSLRTAEAELFGHEIGFVSQRKQGRVKSLGAPTSGQRRLPVAMTAIVDSVTPAGRAPVFDITTVTHEFSAGGIVVHNCPEEAFEQAIEGAVFGDEMTAVREAGRIGVVPLDVNFPVNTYWDFGLGARNPVWLHQRIGLQNRWVKYFDDFGKGLGWWWRRLEEWRMDNGEFRWGRHYLPHDADTEILGESVTTKHRILVAAGMRNTSVVPRVALKGTAIDLARAKLPQDNWFDREQCAEGIKCLDGYQYQWNEKLGRYSNEPLGNWACLAGTTQIRTLAGWRAIADLVGKEFHVWAYSEAERRLVPAKTARCWLAKRSSVVRVHLDHGRHIDCTPDHRFMTRAGGWKQAADLTPGESLMPFYERVEGSRAYTRINLNDGTWADEHRFAYSRLVGHLKDGHVIHHRDGGRFNNEPGNLEQMTIAEHISGHASEPHQRRGLRAGGGNNGLQLAKVNQLRAGDAHHTRAPGYYTDELRERVKAGTARALVASEATKQCPACNGNFTGNWRRLYCCHNCASRAGAVKRNKHGSAFMLAPKHSAECSRHTENHKVLSVDVLQGEVDVYDISVPGVENFVAEGVVVHNSHGADAWMQYAQGYDLPPGGDDKADKTLANFKKRSRSWR